MPFLSCSTAGSTKVQVWHHVPCREECIMVHEGFSRITISSKIGSKRTCSFFSHALLQCSFNMFTYPAVMLHEPNTTYIITCTMLKPLQKHDNLMIPVDVKCWLRRDCRSSLRLTWKAERKETIKYQRRAFGWNDQAPISIISCKLDRRDHVDWQRRRL